MSLIKLIVNNVTQEVDVDPDTPLLWVLRDTLGYTGTKFSCGIGECGACTVLVDDEATRACMTPVANIASKQVTTIEGLSADGSHPLQRAWISEGVAQCGYCQPGQIMTAAALLARNPHPTESEAYAVMSRVLCRCGSYQRIFKAIHRAIIEGGA